MKYRELGRTGFKVSEIGFGGIPIVPLAREEAVAVVRHCFEKGVTFFDTANMYPTSEEKLGAALKPCRKEAVIATKTAQRDAAGAAEHIDLSLRQLQTDWIDLYQLHNVSNPEALSQVLAAGGAYEAVAKAREAGKIRFIGISSHSIPTAMEALKSGLFQTLQFPFNFIEDMPCRELHPLARDREMGILGMKPFCGGVVDNAPVSFKFLRQFPDVIPLPGFDTVEETVAILGLTNVLRAYGTRLAAEAEPRVGLSVFRAEDAHTEPAADHEARAA